MPNVASPRLALLDHPQRVWTRRSRANRGLGCNVRAPCKLLKVAASDVEQDPVPINKDFGSGQADDQYSDPLVMGCCAEVSEPFCDSSASQSCYLDLIQTSCQSLSVRIDQKAEEQALPGPKEALHKLANFIAGHGQDCRTAFGSTDVDAADPSCAAGGGSSYGPLLAGRQWAVPGTFSGGVTEISNVVITVDQALVTGVHPADLGTAEGCWSLEDNDGAPHFLEIFPSGPLIESN